MTTLTKSKTFDASHLPSFKHLVEAPKLRADWTPPTTYNPFYSSFEHLETVLKSRPFSARQLADLLTCSTSKSTGLMKWGFSSYVGGFDYAILEFCLVQGLHLFEPDDRFKEIQQRISDLHDTRFGLRDESMSMWDPKWWKYRALSKADQRVFDSVSASYDFVRVPRYKPFESSCWSVLADLSQSRCSH